jgi:hypothetical protein
MTITWQGLREELLLQTESDLARQHIILVARQSVAIHLARANERTCTCYLAIAAFSSASTRAHASGAFSCK